ncbi:MAG: hypothetical protein AAF850_07900 [Pseudomonadota bacterium]
MLRIPSVFIRWLVSAVFGYCALIAPTQAGQFVAVGAHVGTTGIGGEAQVKVLPVAALRASGSWLNVSITEEYDGIEYDAEAAFSNAFITADVHPFATGFFLSAGAMFGGPALNLAATPSEPVEIGGVIFTPKQVGTLDGRVAGRNAAPFIGLGFDNALFRLLPPGFSFMAGVAFTGEPDVSLSARGGLLASDPVLQDAITREEDALRDETSGLQYYPVIRFGFTFGI